MSTAVPRADTQQQLGLTHTALRALLQEQLCPIQQHLSSVSPACCPPRALPRRYLYKIITCIQKGQEDPVGLIPASSTPYTSTTRGFKQLAPPRPVPQDATARTDPPAALRHRLRGVTRPQRHPRPHRRTAHKERRRIWMGKKQRQHRGDASPLQNRPHLKRTLTTTRRAPARNDARTHLETAAPQRGGRRARVGLSGCRRQKGCGNAGARRADPHRRSAALPYRRPRPCDAPPGAGGQGAGGRAAHRPARAGRGRTGNFAALCTSSIIVASRFLVEG